MTFTYTSGNARPDLGMGPGGPDADLQRDLNTLAMFPRISLRAGRAKVQRGQDFELAYSHKSGSREYELSAYREIVNNAALTMASPDGLYTGGDILPDLFSGSSIFNAGNYQTQRVHGVRHAECRRAFQRHLDVRFRRRADGGTENHRQLESRRSALDDPRQPPPCRHGADLGHFPADRHPLHRQLSVDGQPFGGHAGASVFDAVGAAGAGLEPLHSPADPDVRGLPWRMEATADLRNLLAQGYLPLALSDGRQVLLMQTPRSFRGGLSFIF